MGSESGISLHAIETRHDSEPFLLPRCYRTIPNHADPSDTTSVPGVEIFEPYIVMDFGGYALGITLNQRVRAPNPIAMKQL